MKLGSVAGVALIDSGNTWRTVISADFAKTLGINLLTDIRPLKNACLVGTAKSGETLDILGETKTYMHLSFGSLDTKFKLRPVVINNLSMNINISGPFLKRHNIDQIHSKNCLRIQTKEIPVFANLHDIKISEVTESRIIIPEAQIIPPSSYVHCKAIVTEIQNNRMPANDGVVVGSIDFMDKHDCHPWINAITKANTEGQIPIGIMNTKPHAIFLPKNTVYGTYRLTCSESETDRYPWRISILQNTKKTKPPPPKDKQPTDYEKLQTLIDTFKLNENPFLTDQRQIYKAANLLLNYWDTFSFDGSFGATTLLKHTIYTENRPPINLRYRPVNPSLEPHLKKQIEEWLRHDVIEPSASPYNFPLVCVTKKNGKFRWCIDYRELNKISKRDTYPIGNIEDNLARLANSKIFSGLDGSGAFHVVPLSEDSKEKTAFSTPFGLYQFKRLPFGLANGPSTYARLIKMVLSQIPTSIAIPYLDDTIIHSPSLEAHFSDLKQVLEAHKQAGLKLQPSKCQLFQKSINYLGHLVSSKGISPLKEHTEIIKTWPIPKNRNEIRSFLGKVGYYRRFIKDFAAIAKPLTDRLSQDGTDDKAVINTTPTIQTSFDKLKSALLNAPILAYPKFESKQPFILDTDWSYENAAIGAVLLQKQDGLERVIAYGAHKLAKSQRNYPPTKGELYAIVYFVNHYKYYLAHRPFLIRTDHQALKYISKMDPPTGMISRWLALLANYDFTIEHRAGKKHQNADALSRCTHLQDNTSTEPQLVDEVISSLQNLPQWTATFLRQQQLEDFDIAFLFPLLSNPSQKHVPDDIFRSLSHTGRLYANIFSSLSLDNHQIVRYTLPRSDNPFSTTRKVYLMPKNLIHEAIFRTHRQIAHLSALATFNRLRLYAFFPNMFRIIKDTLMTCSPCQTKTVRLPDQHHTLKSKVAGFPFQTLSLDFVGPFPPSTKKYTYLLTIKDTFTKWIEAFPLKKATSQEVIRILDQEIFARFGKCETIHTDQGTQFTSQEMKAFCNIHKIRLTHTPAYNPKSNPVERVHREIKAALVALSSNKPSTWADFLPSILYALRTMKNRSTTFTPFQLMYGREPIDDLDTIYFHPRDEMESLRLPEYVRKLKERLDQAYCLARSSMKLAVERQRRSYYRKTNSFEVNDKAWLFTPILGQRQTSKLHTGWSGPWKICKKINDVTYEIEATHFPYPKKEVVSIDRLRRTFDDEAEQVLPPLHGQSVQMNEDFFVQSPGHIELDELNNDDDKDPLLLTDECTNYDASKTKTSPIPKTTVNVNNPNTPTKGPTTIPTTTSTDKNTEPQKSDDNQKPRPNTFQSTSKANDTFIVQPKDQADKNKAKDSTFTIADGDSVIFKDFIEQNRRFPAQSEPPNPPSSPTNILGRSTNTPTSSPTGNSILLEPFSQYLAWNTPRDVADWSLLGDQAFTSSTPERENVTKFFTKSLLPPDQNGKYSKQQTEHNRRVRYEMRTGQSRDDTLDGMKTSKTPPPSPVNPTGQDNPSNLNKEID